MKKTNVRLSKNILPERYRVIIKPDFENFTFWGQETIYIDLKKPTTEIVLHAKELKIINASFKKSANITAVKFTLNKKDETLTLKLGRKLPVGKCELFLEFEGTLNDLMRGFYRSQYTHQGETKWLATTQFEATDARRALPCFDEPSHKSVFDVTLMIPQHMEAISNTLPHTVSEHESGLKMVEFQPTPKMSTYLLAFIVGEFEFLESKTKTGTLVRVFTVPGKKHLGVFALDCAVKTLEFFEDYFKIKYPLPVLDMIAVPDFASGAMENWGAVTYRESALLFDEENSSSANKQWIAIVVAHELAHQWFGNLVTMEWWTHLWLNEGFASYIEYLAVDKLFPKWQIFNQFVYQDHATALSLDQLASTHPIEVEVHHPNEIDEIFDQISYQKGASVIRMLASFIGEKAFQKGLQAYLKKHSYSNAETEHLWEAFEVASKKPVKKMMSIWTKKSGYPLVKVIDRVNTLRLEQKRYFISQIERRQSNDKTVWPIPLSVYNTSSKKVQQYLFDKKTLEIPKPKDPVKFNFSETGVFRVDYASQLLAKMPIASLPASDRLGIVRDAFALAQSLDFPTSQVLDLLLKYKNEKDFNVLSELITGFFWLERVTFGEKYSKELLAFGKKLFAPHVKRLGFKAKKNEDHVTRMQRSLVLLAAGKCGDQSVISFAKKAFSEAQIDPDLRGAIYTLVAENGGQKEFDQFLKKFEATDLTEEKNRLLRGLCSFKKENLLKKALEFLFSDKVRSQDSAILFSVLVQNPISTELAWSFQKENFAMLLERFGKGGHLFTRIVAPFSVFSDSDKAKEVKAFYKKHGAPGAERTVRQVVEKIQTRALWKQDQSSHLAHYFKSHA